MRPSQSLGSVQGTAVQEIDASTPRTDSKEPRSLRRKISATWRSRSAPIVPTSQKSSESARLSEEKTRERPSEETRRGEGINSQQRTMEKLTRTLGEHIPPELILTGIRGNSSHDMTQRKKLRRKSRSMTEIGKQFGWSKETENALAEVLKRLPDPSSFPAPSHAPLSRSSSNASRSRASRSTSHGRSRTHTAVPVHDLSATIPTPSYEDNPAYRKGREWSGEWNTDMVSVMQALRDLR